MDEQNTQTIPVVEDTPTIHSVKCTTNECSQSFKTIEEFEKHALEIHLPTTPQEVIHIEPVEHEHLFTKDLEGKITCGFEGCTQLPIEETEAMTGEVMEVKAKHAGGRPSKYNEGMLMKAKDYYISCMEGEMAYDKKGNPIRRTKMPLLEELARLCDVHGETLENWSEENEEFFETIKKIKELQKERIIQRGFSATNPTFSIFMLKANHGFIESEKRILSGEKNAEPIQVSSVNYSEATKPGIDEGIRQQIIEEGVE